jgi:hypothetical protein
VNKIESVESVVAETNAVVPVSDGIRETLVRDLGPVADRLSRYQGAALQAVKTREDAEAAAVICEEIATDIKAVKGHDVLSKITGGLHTLHRRWTGLVGEFITPMDTARRQIKANILAWEQAERAKAEAEQQRLQAIADEAARKERDRLEKLADTRKTPEVKEAYREQAAQVAAPVIQVAAPVVNIRRQKKWTVNAVDEAAFYAALAQDKNLRGYVEIDRNRLARAKAANPSMNVPGITFDQITV